MTIHIQLDVDIDFISHMDGAYGDQGMDIIVSQVCKGTRYQKLWNISDQDKLKDYAI